MGPWVSGNSRFLDGFPRFSGTPPFPSISHVFHMFAIGLMGCLWANGFRSQRQFQSRSVHPIESQQSIRYRCEEQRDQHDTNWGGRPHQSIKAHPEHRIPTAISYGHVQHHVKTCYNIHVVMKCDRPLAQHGDSSASCKEMTIKASKPLDSISAVACTKKIISSSAYWKTSEQRNASRVGAVWLGLIWACGPMGHNLNNVAEHVADMWSSGYTLSILSSFKTRMLHHDKCKPWQQISVSMARDDIWRTHCGKIGQVDEHRSIHENFRGTSCSNGKGTDPERPEKAGEARKKNRCSPVANGCTTSGEHTLNPQRSPEMGTLATHSERTFDSLPLVHIGQFVKTWYKWYNHVWPKTSKDIFPANTLLNSGCQGAMQTWNYASRGSLGRGSICDSGISASEAALGVGELSEPLRTVCSSCLHVVTAMNLWQFVGTCRISVWLEGGKCDL